MSRLTNLQHLDLDACWELTALPPQVGCLQQLNLYACSKLESLPDTFGSLSELRVLTLPQNLTSVSGSFMCLSSLQHLRLHWCANLPSGIPGSFLGGMMDGLYDTAAFGLRNLRSLDLSYCRMHALSNSFVVLIGLRQLNLRDCSLLQTLPHRIECLCKLRKLNLAGCWKLVSLPTSFGNLSDLQMLYMTDCQMVSLPLSFSNLKSLQTLCLSPSCAASFERLSPRSHSKHISVYCVRFCVLCTSLA